VPYDAQVERVEAQNPTLQFEWAPIIGSTRFSFGLGTGLKQFLGSHFAIKAEAKWLPILIAPEVSSWACGVVGAGGCLVVLTGPAVQQFELSIGPVVRF